MPSKKSIQDDWNNTISKLAISNYDLNELRLLDEFENNYRYEPSFKDYKFNVEKWKSFIYEKSGDLNNAIKINEKLLKEIPVKDEQYPLVLLTTARTYDKLKNSNKILPILENYLLNEKLGNTHKLDLLVWYANNLTSVEPGKLVKFESLLAKLASELGIDYSGKQFVDDVNIVFEENKAASKRLSQFLMDIQTLSNPEKRRTLTEFIKKEKIGFYRNLAVKYKLELN